ncbi:hypothetical protein [Methylobacterium sp. V23]|uniref:hypothetical protein n=1 Tax=Methylobacterium sp. V23 TaxID=2044878 RepID=UPI0011B002F3|nr:hypothetical protein [Methylobacterium sp. V23]
MSMRFSSASALSNAKSQGIGENLLVLLVRLIRHPGYSRDAIVSEQLKRCFPKSPEFGLSAEETLRRRFAQSGIDAKTLIYLTDSAVAELHMAHERSVG